MKTRETIRERHGLGVLHGRTEEFATEHEAFGRARQLLDKPGRHAVSVDDGTGNVLCGVRLHLRLGYAGE